MKKNFSQQIIVIILSIIYVSAYLYSSPYVTLTFNDHSKLTQKIKQNYEKQNGFLAEFDTPIKNFNSLYYQFMDTNKPNKTQAFEQINIFGWISYERKSQKISFQLGLKHISMETILVEYRGYFRNNKIYFHNIRELTTQSYVLSLDDMDIQAKIKSIVEEIELAIGEPRIKYTDKSATIVLSSSLKAMSMILPINIEIDEQLAVKRLTLFFENLNLKGDELDGVNITKENSHIESSMIFLVSSQTRETPTYKEHELIQLDETDLRLFIP